MTRNKGTRRSSARSRAPWLAAACVLLALQEGHGQAADLGPYPAPRQYVIVTPSPCELYRSVYTEAIDSIRRTARQFRRNEVIFLRLKRRRMNNGFDGPDIELNAELTDEQIDVAVKAAQVAIFVARARRLSCASPAALNRIDNEAARFRQEVANTSIWIDPRSFQ